ncbi:uncharacterized protein LOC122956456 [Acropora millepora]|uniref:uncharacterized protein LOC122956456 n=1 Tax=Acropora millepora TaxID=45264 RepID=UPI001CF2C422|nr:uncharacterized protein LOC122956456 [Acropora millepora]
MPSFCCLPKCNQKGYSTSSGEKASFFNFPKAPLIRKQWIHAIRRDEGKDFVITERTEVCSLHFRSEDLRKSINGRIYIKEGGVPSKFNWSGPSPKKRKAPTERQPLPAKKKLLTEDNVSVNNEVQETIEMSASEPSTSFEEDTCKTPGLERQIAEQRTKIGELEEKLKQAESEINNLRHENTELNEKLAECERQQKEMSSGLFCVDCFTADGDISFYTGLSSYATFMATFEYLNPGDNCSNIRSRGSVTDVPEDFDDEENVQASKKGRRRKLKPLDEFFIVLCRLRRGFSEKHLAHLYGVAQSTVSRIFVPWINYMYLKFGQICIWPSKEVVQATMPADFKEKFPTTRVIIDCMEVRCEMPSSLLLNSELFSSYKNHVTLKGLVGIAPSGAITFISQLYTGSISDREIVIQSGFLSQKFENGDTVMADKGFQIADILPLGVKLNIPPFLGANTQMSAEDVVRTQQIAGLRIHVERAINKIKNFLIWKGEIPLSLFSVVNQMWSVCAFLCNTQDPLISE